nr:hypothetical protein [Tanacetum cinerariifolium]
MSSCSTRLHYPFEVATDASGIGIGAGLQQDGHLIVYLSKALAPEHKTLSTYEKEFLAIMFALEKWRGITTAQMKVLPKLKGFDYEVKYKKGVDNVAADALSRSGKLGKKHYAWTNGQLLRKNKLGMRKDIKKFVKECIICQRYKFDLATYPGLLQPLHIPNRIWESISMNFIEVLPRSQGYSVIFAVVDRLSKSAYLMPLSHPFTAAQVAQEFLDTLFQVKLLISTTYHPQTNGQIKVVNRCLECYLRCMIRERPKEWKKWLSLAELWYNSNLHTYIQTTPFEAVYGQSPPIHVPYLGDLSKADVVDRSLEERGQAIQQHGRQSKFSPKSFGPFQVVEKIRQVSYKLTLPSHSQIHNVIHASQMKLGSWPKRRMQLWCMVWFSRLMVPKKMLHGSSWRIYSAVVGEPLDVFSINMPSKICYLTHNHMEQKLWSVLGLYTKTEEATGVGYVGVAAGFMTVIFVSFVGVMLMKIMKAKTSDEMEMKLEEGSEDLDTVWIGYSKMPCATVTRTDPNLENAVLRRCLPMPASYSSINRFDPMTH